MKGYEIIFILDPNTGDEAQTQMLDRVKSIVSSHGGNVVHQLPWGRRKLAYAVKKRDFGIYHVLYVDHAPAAVKEVETQFRFSEDVIKWQSVAVEDVQAEIAAFDKLRNEGSLAKQIGDRGR
jgi:small subunit ribosomal protein S6